MGKQQREGVWKGQVFIRALFFKVNCRQVGIRMRRAARVFRPLLMRKMTYSVS